MIGLCKRMGWLGLVGGWLGLAGCNGLARVGPETTITANPSATSQLDLPQDQAVRLSLAVAQNLDKNGNGDAAIEHYERVLQAQPNHDLAIRRLAVLYDRRADFVKADALYAKAVKARPKDPDLHNDWGYSHYQRNQWAEAERHLRQALELDPKHQRARCNLGLVLGQQGRYDEALACFRTVVSEADSHCNLAFIYWSQGRFAEARRECTLAQQLDPTCAKAQEILAQLDKPSRTAVAARPERGRRNREREYAQALRYFEANSSGNVCLGNCPSVPPNLGLDAAAPQPVYRSPNGTSWVPVPPKGPAHQPGPADGVAGTITWDD